MTFDELLALVFSNNAPRLCARSRLFKNGDIFIAIEGSVYDGHDFINEALIRGAKYIVCQQLDARYQTTSDEARATRHEIITVENSAKAAAAFAECSTIITSASLRLQGRWQTIYLAPLTMALSIKAWPS